MADERFPSPGVDARFPNPGTDVEHDGFPVDARFPELGKDTRFEGGYGSPISVAPGGVAPSAFAYTEGMRLDAHPDYLALTSTTNWQTDVEDKIIVQAFFLVDGSAQAGGYFVQTGESITLFVADDDTPVANIYEYTIDASVNAFILTQPQPVDITEGDTANFSVFAPTAEAYMWEYSTDGTVWQQGFNSNLRSSYPEWTGTASDASVGNTWQITDAHIDMNTMMVRCYLNGGAFITNEVALSVIDVLTQPVVITDASIVGNPVVGERSTGTPATFSGGMVVVTNKWQDSLRDDGGWEDTGTIGTTSPVHEAGMHYRMVSTGDNGVGTPAVSYSNVVGPIIAAETINVLTVDGPQIGGDLPISVEVSGATGAAWFIGPSAIVAALDADELRAGTEATANGTVALADGPVNINLLDGISASGLDLAMVTDGSQDVVIATGAVPFELDTLSPLGSITGTPTGQTTALVTLTLTQEEDDIGNFAVFLATDSPSESDIETGTGAPWSVQGVSLVVGANDQNATGLTADTNYVAYAVVVDPQQQKTTLTSAPFKTNAASVTVDTFTAANGTSILSYVGESGFGWAPGFSTFNPSVIQSNRLVGVDSGSSRWFRRADTGGPFTDQRVTAYLESGSAANAARSIGIAARVATAAKTGYVFAYIPGSGWVLNKRVEGIETVFQTSATPTVSASTVYKTAITAINNGANVDVKGYVNDVLVCSGTDTSGVIASGYGGFRALQNQAVLVGQSLDDFSFEVL